MILYSDNNDQIGLISSLNKLFEKNKKVKSLYESLEISEKLQSVGSSRIIEEDPQARDKELINTFDDEFMKL